MRHHNQPAGVIVATSYDLAHKAASMVRIDYAKPPQDSGLVTLTNMKDVLANEEERKIRVTHEEFQKTDAVYEGKENHNYFLN